MAPMPDGGPCKVTVGGEVINQKLQQSHDMVYQWQAPVNEGAENETM